MGQFNGFKFTSRGLTLHSKVQTGDLLQFTRIAVGDGALGSTDPVALNGLISQKKSLQITKLESLGGGRSVVGTALTNGDVTTGFYLREIGVFAQDPDVGEILYCYGNAGTTADWIPPGAGGGQDLIEQAMNIETITGNAPNVSAVINQSLVFATAAQLGDLSQLQTTAKTSAVAAINEALSKANQAFQQASDLKSRVAAAVTGKGVAATSSDTAAQLEAKIGDIAKDTTALAAHLLYNKVMYASGVKVTGTMPNRGAATVTPSASQQTLPDGYYSSIVTNAVSFDPSKVLAGTTIAGTPGTLPVRSSSAAAQARLLYDNKLYVKFPTGAYPNAVSNNQAEVYVEDSNWTENNIVNEVNIFGKTGTRRPWNGEKMFASGQANSVASQGNTDTSAGGFNIYSLVVSGLSFAPEFVVVWSGSGTFTWMSRNTQVAGGGWTGVTYGNQGGMYWLRNSGGATLTSNGFISPTREPQGTTMYWMAWGA